MANHVSSSVSPKSSNTVTTFTSSAYLSEDEGNLELCTAVSKQKLLRSGSKAKMMVTAEHFVEQSAEDAASTYSVWMMNHLTPLLKLGAQRHLQHEDCGIPSKIDSAKHADETIAIAWQEELESCRIHNEKLDELDYKDIQMYGKKKKKRKRKQPNLPKAVLRAFGAFDFYLALFYYFVSTFFMFAPVLLLEDLVQYFEGIASGEEGGAMHVCFVNPWIEVLGLGVFPILVGVLQTKSQITMVHFSTYVRTAVSALIYKKSLRVSPTAKALANSGKVFNLMSNDAVQLQKITMWLSLGLSCPFLVVIALALIYRQVGKATWIGVAVLVASMPVNAVLFAIIAILRRKVLKQSDDRVNMVNELLNGIRIIKFYAWEKPYGKIVSRSRVKELQYLTYMAYVVAIGFSTTIVSIPIVQPILVFLSYNRWADTPLTAAKAFSTLTLFTIMRFPFVVLPIGLIAVAQCYIASSRISSYLKLPERKDCIVYGPPVDDKDSDSSKYLEGSVTMRESSFAWVDPEANDNKMIIKPGVSGDDKDINSNLVTLRNMNVHIPAGSLVAVVGKVGCGKSSFLCSILGELESINESKVYIPGGRGDQFLAFCPQVCID